jgi:hypothetical protein
VSSSKKRGPKALRVRLPDTTKVEFFTIEVLSRVVSAALRTPLAKSVDPHPLEAELNHDALRASLTRAVGSPKLATKCLVVDFSEQAVRMAHHDTLCWHLAETVEKVPQNSEFDIIIVVHNLVDLNSSYVLQTRLIEACKSRGIGLVGVGTKGRRVAVLAPSGRLAVDRLDTIAAAFDNAGIGAAPPESILPDVAALADLIYGHFEIDVGRGAPRHVPVLVSVERVLADERFLLTCANEIERHFGPMDFTVAFRGLQPELLERFSLGLVKNDASRMAEQRIERHLGLDGKDVVLICDILWNVYAIADIVREFHQHGAARVMCLGIVKYAEYAPPAGVVCKSYIDLEYVDYEPHDHSCPFCAQGDTAVRGRTISDCTSAIGEFDPYTFWELISSVEGAYSGEHWLSDRTKYHYLQRINVAPILQQHGYGIACRLRNRLLSAGIRPLWIHNILCPDEPEANGLAQRLAMVLGKEDKCIIRIPRRYFSGITATAVNPEVESYLKSTYGSDALYKRNVIIVDQAAHHFGTLAALSHLCRNCNATILAFTVFADRIHPSIEVGDWLPDAHYLALYKWPWPPFQGDECPCVSRPVVQ